MKVKKSDSIKITLSGKDKTNIENVFKHLSESKIGFQNIRPISNDELKTINKLNDLLK